MQTSTSSFRERVGATRSTAPVRRGRCAIASSPSRALEDTRKHNVQWMEASNFWSESSSSAGRMVGSGMSAGGVPGRSLPGGSAPTMAPDGNRSPRTAAPGASRLDRRRGQQSPRATCRLPLLSKRCSDVRPAPLPRAFYRLRRRSDEATRKGIVRNNQGQTADLGTFWSWFVGQLQPCRLRTGRDGWRQSFLGGKVEVQNLVAGSWALAIGTDRESVGSPLTTTEAAGKRRRNASRARLDMVYRNQRVRGAGRRLVGRAPEPSLRVLDRRRKPEDSARPGSRHAPLRRDIAGSDL